MTDYLLEFKNVSLAYQDKQVFENLNLSIPRGKIIAILGPSGCGKTSFLRLASRLIRADSGEILFNGNNIFKRPVVIIKVFPIIFINFGFKSLFWSNFNFI